ncbi:hypothetical protein [Leptotrichia trevisanii]|uniref:hypothetical protein n=1 Tax=Leptotrichia trevisanii TaxID=109328 RepID=UPI0026E94204|nr:hypothetical protein [Leptotrichia trevisanii]
MAENRMVIGELFNESALITIRTSGKDIEVPYQYWNPNDSTQTEEVRGYDISIDYKDSENNELSSGEIVIFNLAQSDIDLIREKDTINVKMGYGKDIGEVFTGTITEVVQIDYQLKIKFIEAHIAFNDRIALGLEPTKASKVIKQLADSIGFSVKKCQLKIDKEYRGGFYMSPFDVPLRRIIQVVNDCDSKINIKYDELYIYSKENDDTEKIVLNRQSGLIDEPKKYVKPEKSASKNRGKKTNKSENKKSSKKGKKKTKATKTKSTSSENKKVEYDYTVKCLLIHYLKKTDNVIIESQTFNGKAKIVALSIKNFEMELKVKVLNEVKKNGNNTNNNTRKNNKKLR